MIRSWADLQDFLANGGRLRFHPGGDIERASSWSDADSGAEIHSTLATRALAENTIRPVDGGDGRGIVYVRNAA